MKQLVCAARHAPGGICVKAGISGLWFLRHVAAASPWLQEIAREVLVILMVETTAVSSYCLSVRSTFWEIILNASLALMRTVLQGHSFGSSARELALSTEWPVRKKNASPLDKNRYLSAESSN